MSTWDRLAGSLTLAPGQATRAIVRERPHQVHRLLAGQLADTLPDLLGALFTLCGHAHRQTARLAVAAAREAEAVPTAQDLLALRVLTARDHVRRMLLDWPGQIDMNGHAAAGALTSCPLIRESDAAAALRALPAWLESYLLAMPADEWMGHVREPDGQAWLEHWCELADTPVAAVLRAANGSAQGSRFEALPLRLHDRPAAQRRLAALLADDRPTGDIEARIAPMACEGFETGAWTREGDPIEWTRRSIWTRLASRLIDLVGVGLPESQETSRLRMGAAATGPAEGMAWADTARGLLVHWVRLRGDHVAACHVVSPTDWNFHPQGPLAAELASLREDASGEAKARRLAMAFDPCVPVRVQMREEVVDA